MSYLLHRAISEASLLAAWQEVQANDLEDGRPSERVTKYGRSVLARLADLGRELKAGTWRPSPVYAMEIAKRSGGTRLLAVLAMEVRVVERAVMEVVDQHIGAVLLPWSYAYRKGLGFRPAPWPVRYRTMTHDPVKDVSCADHFRRSASPHWHPVI
ncbi:hypothetical protein [Streptomyces sp. NPDC001680]